MKEYKYIPKKAMVIFAHPDDAEIGTGATIAKWIKNGSEVVYVLATTGSSGSNDMNMTSNKIVDIRSNEQIEAANVLGVKEIISLNFIDGMLESNRKLLSDLVLNIRKFKPETVFTHDPFRMNNFLHRDHRNLGFSVMDAIYPYARDHLHFPEQINNEVQPHKVKDLLFWGSDTPNVSIDVSEFASNKIESLAKHESQLPGLSLGSDYGKNILKRLKDSAKESDFKYAESFRMIVARS
ncbi:MAG: PIG-L family deacetylase [Dehalococcoidales bacterium]|jgi:LmbE family N-acetylglucosaminyl deacetylase|nr:PIG-L family deacetylase [Dehalococcoidia bacterium]NCG34490.1 PIG-L family deacetylase [Dehalococcoidales bacterium]